MGKGARSLADLTSVSATCHKMLPKFWSAALLFFFNFKLYWALFIVGVLGQQCHFGDAAATVESSSILCSRAHLLGAGMDAKKSFCSMTTQLTAGCYISIDLWTNIMRILRCRKGNRTYLRVFTKASGLEIFFIHWKWDNMGGRWTRFSSKMDFFYSAINSQSMTSTTTQNSDCMPSAIPSQRILVL